MHKAVYRPTSKISLGVERIGFVFRSMGLSGGEKNRNIVDEDAVLSCAFGMSPGIVEVFAGQFLRFLGLQYKIPMYGAVSVENSSAS